MDYVSIILSMCIGNAVAWLMAVYVPGADRRLLWNVIIGSIAAGLCGLVFGALLPAFAVPALLLAGPPCAFAAMRAGGSRSTKISRQARKKP